MTKPIKTLRLETDLVTNDTHVLVVLFDDGSSKELVFEDGDTLNQTKEIFSAALGDGVETMQAGTHQLIWNIAPGTQIPNDVQIIVDEAVEPIDRPLTRMDILLFTALSGMPHLVEAAENGTIENDPSVNEIVEELVELQKIILNSDDPEKARETLKLHLHSDRVGAEIDKLFEELDKGFHEHPKNEPPSDDFL